MSTSDRKTYSAPALEKGLDLLELLAETGAPMATSAMAEALGRSRSEIFRMVSVLEDRGYIARSGAEEGFMLTPRLLELAMSNPPTRSLLDVALPVMERLSRSARQSCHLAVQSGTEMAVIARVESPDEVGFAVRIGHRRSLADSTSGRVLLAFQSDADQAECLARVAEEFAFDEAELHRDLARIRRLGYRRARSSFVSGIVDLGAPVTGALPGPPLAALTIPYVQKKTGPEPMPAVIELLLRAALEISNGLGVGAPVRLKQVQSSEEGTNS